MRKQISFPVWGQLRCACQGEELNNLSMTLHLDRQNTTDPKPEMLSAVSSGNRIQCDERYASGIEHVHMFRKDDFLEQRLAGLSSGMQTHNI